MRVAQAGQQKQEEVRPDIFSWNNISIQITWLIQLCVEGNNEEIIKLKKVGHNHLNYSNPRRLVLQNSDVIAVLYNEDQETKNREK